MSKPITDGDLKAAVKQLTDASRADGAHAKRCDKVAKWLKSLIGSERHGF